MISKGQKRSKRAYANITPLRKLLRRLKDVAQQPIKDVLKEGANKILDDAKAMVPVDEGHVHDNLKVKISRDGFTAKIGIMGKRDTKKAFYARFIEWGTVKEPARPFLMPAYYGNEEKIKRELKKEIGRALSKVTGV